MARKTREEQQLEDLQRYADESYLQRTDVQRALRAQGVNMPGAPKSDASNPLSGDEEGPASVDANGVTAVSAVDATVIPEEDELDALTRSTQELQDATRQRRAADRLRQAYPDTDQAQQQAVADQIQQALGDARRFSNATQGGIRDRVLSAADRLGAVRTPGGIAALLLIIFLLLFVLVDQNGQPRGVWMWLVLLRKARLRPEGAMAGSQSHNAAPTEPAVGAVPGAAGVLAQGGSAVAANTMGANITPINIISNLRGSGSALDRYVNP